jgi:hypothetical protein
MGRTFIGQIQQETENNLIIKIMDKLTEVQKAEQIIREAEQKKMQEFSDKINALCKEYGYSLQPYTEMRIVKVQ